MSVAISLVTVWISNLRICCFSLELYHLSISLYLFHSMFYFSMFRIFCLQIIFIWIFMIFLSPSSQFHLQSISIVVTLSTSNLCSCCFSWDLYSFLQGCIFVVMCNSISLCWGKCSRKKWKFLLAFATKGRGGLFLLKTIWNHSLTAKTRLPIIWAFY